MTADHRSLLLSILSQLDQIGSEAAMVVAGPSDAEMRTMVRELRALVINLQASVEEQLEQLTIQTKRRDEWITATHLTK